MCVSQFTAHFDNAINNVGGVSERIILEWITEKNDTRLLVRIRCNEQRPLNASLHFVFSNSEILRGRSSEKVRNNLAQLVPLERNSKSSPRTVCGTSVTVLTSGTAVPKLKLPVRQ